MQSSVVGTLAVGITIVLLIGDIDLSVAATSGVCAAILAVLTTNLGIPAPISCLAALSAGVCVGIFQGAMSALVGIPSFVVTLAGLLGFQGLMLKILGIHGAINVRDPFVRGITTTTLPTELGWAAAALCIAAFSWIVWYNRQKRRRLSLENNPWASDLTKVGFFVVFAISVVATLNSYRGVPLVVVILLGLTALLGWLTTSTPFGRALYAVGGQSRVSS